MKAKADPETPKDGAWQVGADGAPFVTVGAARAADRGRTGALASRGASTDQDGHETVSLNGVPDVNPVRQYAKAHGCSRREAERRLLALLTDAASE